MANEKRLIDVDVLSGLLNVEYGRKMKLVRKGETHLDTLAEGIISVAVLLGTMPTVDAVEVVRCKDCEYFWKSFSGTHSCKLHKGLVSTKYDTFCSYGKRRSDNA